MRKRGLVIIASIVISVCGACSNGKSDNRVHDVVATIVDATEESSTFEEETSLDAESQQNSETASGETSATETLDTEISDNEVLDDEKQDIQTDDHNDKVSVDIVMVGDVLLHTRVAESGLMADGTYNYDHMFANVKDDIEGADIAIVNQEVILGGRDLGLSGYPAFNGAFEVGDSLVKAGFDVVLHATNHALDKGKKGLLSCLSFWEENYPDIGVLGIYDTEEDADEIYVHEENGIKIAILNYTYGTNGISLPNDMPYAVDLWDEDAIRRDVEVAKEEADFVIVCPHWGTEYVLEETYDQREKAQFLADLGVDLVIGTHPHVVEPIEWVTGENGNEMLVYYSIGNFINATEVWSSGVAKRMLGAMAEVTITKDGDDAYIEKYGVEPLVSHLVEGSGLMTTYRLSDYTEELANKNEIKHQDDEFSVEYCEEICKDVFGELFSESEE